MLAEARTDEDDFVYDADFFELEARFEVEVAFDELRPTELDADLETECDIDLDMLLALEELPDRELEMI